MQLYPSLYMHMIKKLCSYSNLLFSAISIASESMQASANDLIRSDSMFEAGNDLR